MNTEEKKNLRIMNWTGVENYALVKKVKKLFNAQQVKFLEDGSPFSVWERKKSGNN